MPSATPQQLIEFAKTESLAKYQTRVRSPQPLQLPSTATPKPTLNLAPPPTAAGAGASTAAAGAGASTASGGAAASSGTGAGAGAVGSVVAGAAAILTLDFFFFAPPGNQGEDEALKKERDKRFKELPGLYPDDAPQITQPGVSPFTGGQMAVPYEFITNDGLGCKPFYGSGSLEAGPNTSGKLYVTGPIASIGSPNLVSGDACKTYSVQVSNASGSYLGYFKSDFGSANSSLGKLPKFFPWRADGKADTGGNPPASSPEYSSSGGTSASSSPPDFVSPSNPSPSPTPTAAPTAPPLKLPSVRPVPSPTPTVAQPDPAPSPPPQAVPQSNPTSRTFWDPIPSQVTPSTGVKPDEKLGVEAPPVPIPGQTVAPQAKANPPAANANNQPITLPGAGITRAGQPAPAPTTTPTPAPTPTPTPADPKIDFPKWWDTVGLVTIGTTLSPVYNPQIRQAIETAAKNGACQSLNGGCTTGVNVNQQVTNAANNSAAANALLQGADLALLGVIDQKLGAQIPNGGIAGFLTRAFQATRLDKIINALTLITTLHNAAMLSRNLGQTLGDLTSQALATIGIKDENGGALDINGEIGRQVNNLMSTILGAETWAGTKLAWNKANTILSSASQIVHTVRSIADSAREIQEWTASNLGKIGNALKRNRVVESDAYGHMSENVQSQNSFMLKVQRYRDGVDSIDDAASSFSGVLGEFSNITSEMNEFVEQKQRFDAAIKAAQPKTIPDNDPVKERATATKTASQSPPTQADVFRGAGETDNA